MPHSQPAAQGSQIVWRICAGADLQDFGCLRANHVEADHSVILAGHDHFNKLLYIPSPEGVLHGAARINTGYIERAASVLASYIFAALCCSLHFIHHVNQQRPRHDCLRDFSNIIYRGAMTQKCELLRGGGGIHIHVLVLFHRSIFFLAHVCQLGAGEHNAGHGCVVRLSVFPLPGQNHAQPHFQPLNYIKARPRSMMHPELGALQGSSFTLLLCNRARSGSSQKWVPSPEEMHCQCAALHTRDRCQGDPVGDIANAPDARHIYAPAVLVHLHPHNPAFENQHSTSI